MGLGWVSSRADAGLDLPRFFGFSPDDVIEDRFQRCGAAVDRRRGGWSSGVVRPKPQVGRFTFCPGTGESG
ncbi:hypothetical protein APASM_6980 [Actinosynnema pretiosum subsp. pretiosum]|nr:hypothetical protein APASM_6980 [Actinosynnema pretiosum subsp. pretiosum]